MAGLLDFIGTPEGQGLLAATFGGLAGARRGQPINNIGKAGVAGLLGYGNAQDRMSQEAQAAENTKFRTMQTSALQDQIDQRKAVTAQEAAKRAALPTLFAGTTLGGGATTPELGGIPMFSQGSTAVPMQTQGAGRIDFMRALQAGYTPEEISKMAVLPDAGRPEVARTADVEGPNGAKLIQGFDKFGMPVGQGASGYVAPVSVNQGDRQTFVKPMAGVSLPVNMSPSERDASSRGWASNSIQRERLNFDKAGGADAGKPQLVDGQWVYKPTAENPQGRTVPVNGFSPKLPESQQKQVVGVNNLSNAITEYRAQLKDFGSMDVLKPDARAEMGTKYNNMMLQAKEAYNLGVLNGPDLAILTSVITDPRSFTGAITSKSSLDKQASELDRIMRQVGSVSGQARQPNTGGATGDFGDKPKGQAFDSKPPAQQYKGKSMTGPDGKRYTSDGMAWKEVK